MGAPIGNQFWKLRSKHGRDKIFATPEMLWQAASEYFEATDKRKWYKTEYNGKDARECYVPVDTPYTITGLCLYLDCGKNFFEQFEKSENSKDFSGIIARIREIIYTQKFEGAAVGTFNANIIARDLGLRDNTESNIAITTTNPELLKAISDRMNG